MSRQEQHTWVEEHLSDYVDNALPALERSQLERHLAGCTRCQKSLDALRWTVSLLKQAPAPKLPRTFVLPVEVKPELKPARPAFGMALVGIAAAMATLVLVSLIGVDLLLTLGGARSASAPPPAAFSVQVAPPTSVALIPPPTPTRAADMAVGAATNRATAVPATAVPQPTSAPLPATAATAAPQPTSAPLPTTAPAAANAGPTTVAQPPRTGAQPLAGTRTTPGPTATVVFGRGGAAPQSTSGAKALGSSAETADATSPVAPKAPLAPASPTMPAVPATGTATPAPSPTPNRPASATATAVPKMLAQVEPTRPAVAPPPPAAAVPEPVVTPLRIAELGALFFTVFLGTIALLLWKKR